MIIFIICLALGVSLRKVFTCFVTGRRGEEEQVFVFQEVKILRVNNSPILFNLQVDNRHTIETQGSRRRRLQVTVSSVSLARYRLKLLVINYLDITWYIGRDVQEATIKCQCFNSTSFIDLKVKLSPKVQP